MLFYSFVFSNHVVLVGVVVDLSFIYKHTHTHTHTTTYLHTNFIMFPNIELVLYKIIEYNVKYSPTAENE